MPTLTLARQIDLLSSITITWLLQQLFESEPAMRFTPIILCLVASILVAQPASAFFHNYELLEQLEYEKSQREASEARAAEAEQRARRGL